MKYIKPYNKSNIDSICKKYKISNYTINGDGSIDVAGNVDLQYHHLKQIPLRFNKVIGYFYCFNNYLTTLEGGPKYVGGNFFCNSNELTTLEGCPKYVGGYFKCDYNDITSVRGFPEDFEGLFWPAGNPVYELFKLFHEDITDDRIAHLLNEYDVISLDGKKVYRDNIEEALNLLGSELPKDIKLRNYEIH